MRITNIQKKELSEISRETGLNILDFEVSGQFKEFKVQFKHEYFSFEIDKIRSDLYSLTILPVNDTKGNIFKADWEDTKKRFKNWANQLYKELNTPTGWQSFQSENFLNAELKELENGFSETEKQQVKQSIDDLKEKIKTLELASEKLEIILEKLSQLSKKVDDLSKFDWKSMFIGNIANLIMVLGIPPETSGMLWEYIKMAFSGLRLNA
jgi:ATP-dependent Lon protease